MRAAASGFRLRASGRKKKTPGSRSFPVRSPRPEARSPSAERRLKVVAAALYDSQGRVLIAERPPGRHMAGRWEFPGGKIGDRENEREALERELAEELGVRVLDARPFMRLLHDYGERTVELSMWIIERYSGEPRCLDGQRLKWLSPQALGAEDILEADKPFIEALRDLPAPAT